MELGKELAGLWRYGVALLTLVLAVVASGHAVLYKRDSRSTVLWVGFIWLAPLVGGVLYFLLGVNRIRRRAVSLRRSATQKNLPPGTASPQPLPPLRGLGPELEYLGILAGMVERVVSTPLAPGNRIDPLLNGDAAFPEMIRAIENATKTVTLATYIFDHGQAGDAFIKALAAAVAKGVQVRVLIDDTGARYSWPTVLSALRRAGVSAARFLPTLVPIRVMAINLRTHRKSLIVDGRIAFTGGMNIRDGHLIQQRPARPIQDIQFRIEGPVVTQLQTVCADDWLFTTGEDLEGDDWFPHLDEAGTICARGIPDGPNQDFEKLRWTLLGALATARSSVRILTPYFLPDQSLISALNVAALRGVRVDIILPERSNLPFVHWATFAILWQMLEHGCRVWLTPPPFDHSKLMLVDGSWALLGSANWDPRSLRLNFELSVECYSQAFGQAMADVIENKLRQARELTLAEVNSRSLHVKLRDGVARLFTPFL